MKKLLLSIIVFCFLTSLVFFSPAFAQDTVVVPNDLADTDANGSIRPPFNCTGLDPTKVRW